MVKFFVTLFASRRTNSTLSFRSSNPKSYANPQSKKPLHSNHLHRSACAKKFTPKATFT
jgi:hypothetical protein